MTANSFTLIEDASALREAIARAAQHPVIAVDTEAASFHRFVDRIYLVQLSTPIETVLVDPLAVPHLEPLGALLASQDVEKVFHDADYDIRVLDRDYGFHPRSLFDTRLAAQLIGEPAIGLAALLEKYFDLRLSKTWQRADWSQRPLPAAMLAYAASDTAHLLALRDRLEERLRDLGRWSWAEEEFHLAEGVRWTVRSDAPERYLRIKGAKKLDPHQLVVLRELHGWRMAEAQRRDRAEFRIVSNETLLALTQARPTSRRSLHGIHPLASSQVKQYGDALLAAVQRGIESDPAPAPPRATAAAFKRDRALQEQLNRLRAVRNHAAEALHMDPGVLCGRPTLEAIAAAAPSSKAALWEVPGVRQWQVEALGDALLEALR